MEDTTAENTAAYQDALAAADAAYEEAVAPAKASHREAVAVSLRTPLTDYTRDDETSAEAIKRASAEGWTFNLYADPENAGRRDVSSEDALDTTEVDASLVYLTHDALDELAFLGCVERVYVLDGDIHVDVLPMHDEDADEATRLSDLDESCAIIKATAAKHGYEDTLEGLCWSVILRFAEGI